MNYFNITFSSTGKYNWTVNCTDTTGISTIAPARTLYIDNSSPAINLYNPQPGDSIYNSTVNFNYSASDDFDNLLSCNLTMDGVVNRTNISTPAGYVINISINLSTQSIHYWNVSCWDDAGNINTSETRNFSNFVPSAITLYAPGINATLNYGQNIRFDYMPNDANGINFTQLILNGKVNATSYNVTVGFMNYFYANLTDGFYSWTVNATNNVGLVGTANSRNFTVDTTPPNVIYTYPNNTAVVGWNNVTFNFTATDNIASVMACNVTLNNSILYSNISITNGTPFVFTQILGDGNYNWSVSCKDATNWTNIPTVVNFSVSAPPNVTLNWPINYYRNNTVNIVFNYTPYDAIGFQNCTLYYDGAKNITQGIIVKNQPNYFTLNNLNGGVHNWTVQCIDLAPDLNVYAPPVAYFIIDLTGPNITLLSPQPNQTFNLNNVTFNWTPIDYNGTAINCTIAVTDNPANRTANISALSATVFSQQFNNLSEGIHYWNVSCMDDLGNMNYSGIWNFTINQADLSINTSDIIFNNTNPDENQSLRINATVHNIGGVTANNVLVEFWDGNPGLGGIFIGNDTGTIGINGSRSFSTQWNISLGYHTIYVLSDPHNAINDLNRNNNNATINISVLRSIITAPSNSTGLASANVSINFTLQDFTNGALNYSVFVDNLSNGQNGTAVDNNSYAINVTFAQGMHSIKIEGLDYLGRRKNSTAVFLLIDYTPPNSTINTQNNTWYNYSHPQINITSYDNIAAMINYTIFANGSANIFGNITNGTSLLVNLSFASDGAYAIMMQSFDELNNTANSSVKIIYVDTHPPGIQLYSPVNGANFTSRAVSLNYSFYDNLASYGMCNLTLDGINVASYNSTLNYIMNYTANNLIEGSHYWNVSCIDIAGNINVSQTRSFNIYIFPNISLVNPPNNYWSNTENNTFYFNVSDETGLQNCSVIINGQVSKTKNNSQLTNNATNNITVNNTLSGNYSWFIECYDNTSYRTYSNTSSRTLYVDTISPQPMIETINNTWYNMTSPSITFNITDNMDDMLNYTIYVDGSINRTGTVSNSTSTSINLTGILDGVHSIVLEAVDEALNKKNSSPIIIYIDTIKPSINLTYPPNGTNITTNYINLNFTPYDNLAPYLICNLTLDGNIIGSNLNVSNGSNANISVTNLIGGNHYWNVSCIDIVGNKNTSANSIFYVMMPDLYIDNASIWFSNYNLIENQTITVFANVTNIGNVNASNFTVEIRLNALNGTLLYNASMNISANGSKQISLNYTVPLGLSDFYVLLDTPLATNGTVKEENESNNWAHRAVYVAFWQYLLGTTNDKLVINDNVNSTLFDWVVSNSTGSNLYATDVDSVISWTKLQALGRSAANASSFNDFAALDIKLNSTSYSDSVNKTFTTTGNPIELANYTIFNRLIKNISIVNSTNNSNFKTGILWDTSQGGASYNGNQDVVFVSQIHKNMQGYNGTVDYEMRVPASLRSYRAGYDMIALYIEIN
jgi:hypothetical protein